MENFQGMIFSVSLQKLTVFFPPPISSNQPSFVGILHRPCEQKGGQGDQRWVCWLVVPMGV